MPAKNQYNLINNLFYDNEMHGIKIGWLLGNRLLEMNGV